MQIILPAIRGTALIEGARTVMKEHRVGVIFSDVQGMVYGSHCNLSNYLSIIVEFLKFFLFLRS